MKTTLKLKINPVQEYPGLIIYPIKPSAGLFFLSKSRETIPLSNWKIVLVFCTSYFVMTTRAEKCRHL
jgi:hypothetical protein